MSQYNVVVVNLNPTIGSEIKKIRPCVIISPNEMNENLNTVIVAPMTSSKKKYPTRVSVNFKSKDGFIAIDQIRTVDKKRISAVIGRLREVEILMVKKILQETFIE